LACEVGPLSSDAKLYTFGANARAPKAAIVHFQLRHLVHATSAADVFLSGSSLHGVCHWHAVTRKQRLVLPVDLDVQISTCAAWVDATQRHFVAAGGFSGELMVKAMACLEEPTSTTDATPPGVTFSRRISTDENAITNAIVPVPCLGGGGPPSIVASNNDCRVRIFDMHSMAESRSFTFPWAVNYTAVSPCGRQAVVVGDNMRCALMDMTSGSQIAALGGHLDFSFAAAWHPSGSCFVTGSQDATARIWDVRRLATSRRVLQGKLGAIRSLRYSADGTVLAALEPADFVHVYDCGADYRREQLIDLFGENAGVSFSPCGEVLFVGVSDLTYGSLVEYHRVQPARWRLPRL
jgi:WD40 repeat protein